MQLVVYRKQNVFCVAVVVMKITLGTSVILLVSSILTECTNNGQKKISKVEIYSTLGELPTIIISQTKTT